MKNETSKKYIYIDSLFLSHENYICSVVLNSSSANKEH
jgi:hypothetical protein